MIGGYFTYNRVIDQPGRLIKVVSYPTWQFSCIVLFDVQVTFCCTPSNVANAVKCKRKTVNVKTTTVSKSDVTARALNK